MGCPEETSLPRWLPKAQVGTKARTALESAILVQTLPLPSLSSARRQVCRWSDRADVEAAC